MSKKLRKEYAPHQHAEALAAASEPNARGRDLMDIYFQAGWFMDHYEGGTQIAWEVVHNEVTAIIRKRMGGPW